MRLVVLHFIFVRGVTLRVEIFYRRDKGSRPIATNCGMYFARHQKTAEAALRKIADSVVAQSHERKRETTSG